MTIHRRPRTVASLAAAAAVSGLLLAGAGTPAIAGVHPTASGKAVLAWNATAGEVALAACLAPANNPLHESRMYAMLHIAVHDALNAIDRRSEPYAYRGHANPRTSTDAAIAAAARDTLVSTLKELPGTPECRAAGLTVAETAYTKALAAVHDGKAKSRGIDLGRAAAAAVLELRKGDGSDTLLVDNAFPQGTRPGEYRYTPGTPFVFAPGWGTVTPFALEAADQFRPGPPPALTSHRYARDVAEVKRLGGDGVTTASERTARQTQTALFWVESSPLAWNRIARTIGADRHLDAWKAARLFGVLNMAMADGYVATFDTKYDDLFWRPVTAIRLAGTDGNPATSADPTWTPLLTTPPVQDYDSGHAVEGGAAAAAIRGVLGTDHVAFTACSRTLPAGQTCTDAHRVVRHYSSLSEAAAENGESRILVGFHFRTSVRRGIHHGDHIGEHVVETSMRPVHG